MVTKCKLKCWGKVLRIVLFHPREKWICRAKEPRWGTSDFPSPREEKKKNHNIFIIKNSAAKSIGARKDRDKVEMNSLSLRPGSFPPPPPSLAAAALIAKR